MKVNWWRYLDISTEYPRSAHYLTTQNRQSGHPWIITNSVFPASKSPSMDQYKPSCNIHDLTTKGHIQSTPYTEYRSTIWLRAIKPFIGFISRHKNHCVFVISHLLRGWMTVIKGIPTVACLSISPRTIDSFFCCIHQPPQWPRTLSVRPSSRLWTLADPSLELRRLLLQWTSPRQLRRWQNPCRAVR